MNENLKGDQNHEYGVEWGLAHPEFLRMAENTNDIGLFRLDKDAIIRQAKIEISLITSHFFTLSKPIIQDWFNPTNLSSQCIF